MMQILKTLLMSLPKHCQALAPEDCIFALLSTTLSHTKICHLTHGSNTVSTNLSEVRLSFKFTQVKKSDSYKIISQLTFIIKHH